MSGQGGLAKAESSRADAIARFLGAAGWGRAERRPLAGDASFRRYERLALDGACAILMDAPPPQEDVRPFVRIAELLARHGFAAPAIRARDESAGLLLLEDFGDATFTRVLATEPGNAETLYAAAVDVLVAIHERIPAAAIAHVPRYDTALYTREASLFPGWYLPALHGNLRPGETEPVATDPAFQALWRRFAERLGGEPECLVLRDYHADNLMCLGGRSDGPLVGLLDFQDAVIGPTAYDLVSLLEDARRDVPDALRESMIQRYLALRPATDPEAFRAAYALLGAQRNLKIVGIFTRLAWRDGKPQYLAMIPRVFGHLARDLAHPACGELRDWLDAALPIQERIMPPAPPVVQTRESLA